MGKKLRKFIQAVVHQLKVFVMILATGAVLLIVSPLMLLISNDLESAAAKMGLLGTKIMIFAYPVYLFILLIKLSFKK